MAAENFDRCLSLVLVHEGGFVDHPRDPGGATNLGITQATLSKSRGRPSFVEDVRRLTKAEAGEIYRGSYWASVEGDRLPGGLDLAVFDFAVNSGPRRAVRMLQDLLGVAEDGVIGPHTLAAADAADVPKLIADLSAARLRFLGGLSTWSVFGTGWRRRVQSVERQAKELALIAQREPAAAPILRSTPVQKGPSMLDTKSMLASRTVWANVIGLASIGLSIFGVHTGQIDANGLADAMAQLVAAGSFVASTVFRVTATRQIAPERG
jgi:lysozyme family protein